MVKLREDSEPEDLKIVELKVFENTLASLDNSGRLTYLEVN